MKFKQIDDAPKTFILVFQTGDELARGLLEFAQEQGLTAASFQAIGALNSVRQVELLSSHRGCCVIRCVCLRRVLRSRSAATSGLGACDASQSLIGMHPS